MGLGYRTAPFHEVLPTRSAIRQGRFANFVRRVLLQRTQADTVSDKVPAASTLSLRTTGPTLDDVGR